MSASPLRGWGIVALLFCALGLTVAARSSVGVMMPVWQAELGWPRTLSSAGSSTLLAVMAFASPLAGGLIDRYGPRLVLAGGLAILGVAVATTSTVSAEWQFLLVFGLVGGFGFGAVSLPLTAIIVARGFARQVGLATGIAMSGSTGGQLPVLTLLGVLVTAWGWRGAYLAFGAALLALVPLATLMLGGMPELAPRRHAGAGTAYATLWAQLSFLAESRTFLLLLGAFTLCGFTTAGVIDVHFVPYAVSCGYTLIDSTAAYGAHGIGNMVGLILFGWLADRVHRGYLLSAMFFVRALLFILLLHVAGHPTLLYVFAVLFGVLNYATFPVIANIVASHIGVRIMGLTMGLLFGGHSLGAALGAFFGGYVYDLSARYDWVWLVSIGLALAAALFAVAVPERFDRDRPRYGVAQPA